MTLRIAPLCALCAALLQLAASGRAAAQAREAYDDPDLEARAAAGARAGMFLPLTEAPRTDTQRAFASTLAGYDAARESLMLEGRGEATVLGPIALRIGVLYSQTPERLRPSGGVRVQALAQDAHAIDLSVGAYYKPEGFTEAEGEIEAVVALGRRFGRLGLFADVVYGQDPDARERDGELRLAALCTLTKALQLGLDSRARFDLGSDADKLAAEGGAKYDWVGGPVLAYAFDAITVGTQVGMSVVDAPHTQVGPVALAMLSGSM